MGGRVASQVLAKAGLPRAVGAVFLGYPLHPPGKPETRRDAHLPDVGVPMLFVQGARDPFGTAREIRALARRLPDARVHVVAQGDHSLAVPKRAAVTGAAALDLAADAVASFMKEVVARGAKKAK